MVRWLIMATVSVVAASCGSSEESAASYTGNWLFENADNSGAIGLDLEADGQYAVAQMVIVGGNAIDAEIERGAFSASPGAFAFTPQESSCPGPIAAYSVNYAQVDSETLSVTQGAVTFVMKRNHPTSTQSIAIGTGCFATDGSRTFTPRAVAPVLN